MKTLTFGEEQYQAEKIVKGDDYITGINDNSVEFEFSGILDFSPFTLAEGEDWDVPNPKPYTPKVVDDLTTGGHSDVLSAEQGKIIKDYYDTQSAELAKIASKTVLGRVKIDDITIKVNEDGAISSTNNIEIVDDNTTGGRDKAWSAEMGKQLGTYVENVYVAASATASPTEYGRMKNDGVTIKTNGGGQMYVNFAENKMHEILESKLFAPSFVKTGTYNSPTIILQNGETVIGDSFIVNLKVGVDSTDGSIIKFYTTHGVNANDNNELSIVSIYNKIDVIDAQAQNIVINGKWVRVDGEDLNTVKTDIQTLFTNWANETKNAVTALAQKKVTLPQDATMKQVVSGINSIELGKRVFKGKTKPATPSTFYQYGFNGNVNNTICSAIDTTVIPFDVGMIYIGSSTSGFASVTYLENGATVVVSRSIPPTSSSNDFTWRTHTSGSIPKTTEFKIPTEYSTNYDFIAYER